MVNKYPAIGGESIDYGNRPLIKGRVSENTGSGFVSTIGHFVKNILEGISDSYGSDNINIELTNDSDYGNYSLKPSRDIMSEDFRRKNNTPHYSNTIIKSRDYDYFNETDLNRPLIEANVVKHMVEEALNVFSKNVWHRKSENSTAQPISNMDKFVENAKNWNPNIDSVWHSNNFKDATPIEQEIYKNTVPKHFKADEDLTEDDLKEFDFNIKLLSLFKAERENNALTDYIMNKLNETQVSNNFGLPDLSNINDQQMPYSRIPRGLNVSRGDDRENVRKQKIKHTDEVYLSKNDNFTVYTVPQNNYDENKDIWPSQAWDDKQKKYTKTITRINDYTGKLFREFYKMDNCVKSYRNELEADLESINLFIPNNAQWLYPVNSDNKSLYDLKIKNDWPKSSPGSGIFYGKIVSGAYFGNAVFGYTMGKRGKTLKETLKIAHDVAIYDYKNIHIDDKEKSIFIKDQLYDTASIISGWRISNQLSPWLTKNDLNYKKYCFNEIDKYNYAIKRHSSSEIKMYIDQKKKYK